MKQELKLTWGEKLEMCKAAEKLGYKGTVRCRCFGYRRYGVEVNGKHIGIYDLDRHTFVD